MKEFKGKVAVITGAASGIGRGIAEHCVREGMKVVLADVDAMALAQTGRELKGMGAGILAVRTDVSKPSDVESLAKQTLETFGAAHLLFNNAGVGAGTTVWGAPECPAQIALLPLSRPGDILQPRSRQHREPTSKLLFSLLLKARSLS